MKESALSKSISKLPSMSLSFEIQLVGDESRINWVGKFKYTRPNLGARARIDVMRTRLDGDLDNLDFAVRDYNKAVSFLRYTLAEYPDWWRDSSFGFDLYDANIISEIYNKCMEFEEEWKSKVFGGEASSVEVSDDPNKNEAVKAPGAPAQ